MLERVSALEGHDGRIWHVAWSTDGMHLATCGEDKIIRIWAVDVLMGPKELKCIATLEEGTQSRTIRCCSWSPNDRYIASASFCGIIAIWEAQNDTCTVWVQIASLEGHENEVKGVAWSPDGYLLASCGRDKKIWLWEKVEVGEFECLCILEGHTQDVKCIKWHPSKNILCSASYDDTIKIWEGEEDEWYCSQTLIGHKSTVWDLTFNSKENQIVSCSDDYSLILWTNRTKSSWEFEAVMSNLHTQCIYSVDWNVYNKYVVTGGGDNKISITVIEYGIFRELYGVANAHEGDVNCVRWNPNERFSEYMASVGDDGLLRVWRLRS